MKIKKVFNSVKDVIYFIIGIILIIISTIICIRLFNIIIDVIKSFVKNYPTISVAIITALFAFISVPFGKFCENRYNIKNKIREERQKAYIDFLQWLINNVLYLGINNNDVAVDEIKYHQKEMTIYASDKVLKAWSEFINVSMNSILLKKDMNKNEQLKYYAQNEAPYIEKLILEIRKELGYKNENIKEYDILKLYVPDIVKYLD